MSPGLSGGVDWERRWRMPEFARLQDGTPYRRFQPPLPLDERWTLPDEGEGADLRARWAERRQWLERAGRFESCIAATLDRWAEDGTLPRRIPGAGTSAEELLLSAACDAAIVAYLDPNDASKAMPDLPTETARATAARILLRPLVNDADLTPADFAQLQALICPKLRPSELHGAKHDKPPNGGRGRFRVHRAMVLGTDRVFKEAAPPERVITLMVEVVNANARSRRAGVPAIVRAAWIVYAVSVVHPFYDGNGRIARLAGSLALIRRRKLPFILPPHTHDRYMDAMGAARRGEPRALIDLVAEAQHRLMASCLDSGLGHC